MSIGAEKWTHRAEEQAISLPWNNYIARKMGQQTVRLQNHRLKIGGNTVEKNNSPKSHSTVYALRIP